MSILQLRERKLKSWGWGDEVKEEGQRKGGKALGTPLPNKLFLSSNQL